MTLTYARLQDYLDMKKIDSSNLDTTQARILNDYLIRATQWIDRVTGRHFFPIREAHMHSIPVEFRDLSNQGMIWQDIMLDYDLLEPILIQVITGALLESNENVPSGGLDLFSTTFTATDVDGEDSAGQQRFAVGDILQIESERMQVVASDTSSNVVTVDRALFGTLASVHAEGVTISKLSLSALQPGIDVVFIEYNLDPKYGIQLIWPNTWSGGYIGAAYRNRQPQIYITALWGYHERYQKTAWINTTEVVPTGDIAADATTIAVTEADAYDFNQTRFTVGDLIRIEAELMYVTAIDTADPAPDTLTVLRGQNGTLAEDHAEAIPIYRYEVEQDIKEACLAIAKTWRDADNSVGGRQGVSEVSTGVELALPKDTTAILKLYRRSEVG